MKHLKYPYMAYVGLLAAGLLLAPGCGSKKEDASGGAGTPQNAATPSQGTESLVLKGPVAEQMRTVQAHPDSIDHGKELFAQCIGCHGPTGGGTQGLAPRLNSKTFLAAASDDMLMRTITKGRVGTPMIPWGSVMKPDDISAVISYIRSWSDVKEAVLDEGPLHGDAVAGKRLFADVCAGCHGRTGAGLSETANGTGIGRKGFSSEVSNGYLRYVIKNGKSQTKMRGFAEDSRVAIANLTDKQIDDVIVHLRSSAW